MPRQSETEFVVASLVGAAVILVVALQAFGTFGGGSPTELSPAPMPLALVYFVLLGPLAIGIPGLAFLAWTFLVRAEIDRMPRRSVGLFLGFGVMSLAWYGVGRAWEYYDWRLFAINAAFVIATSTAVVLASKRPSMVRTTVAHTLFFSWLGSYAFPWVGEVP